MYRAALALALLLVGFPLSATAQKDTLRLTLPDERTIPDGPLGDAVRYGKNILTQTTLYARAYVGNELNCSSCHLDAGTKAYAAPWVGLWGMFPEYRGRNAKVNSLQERVNDCFERSINGRPLALDSDEMRAILSYVWWLSRRVPTGVEVRGRGFVRIKAERAPDP